MKRQTDRQFGWEALHAVLRVSVATLLCVPLVVGALWAADYVADPSGSLLDGRRLRPEDASIGSETSFTAQGTAGAHGFDTAVADLNDDGFDDLVVGYPSANQVRIYFGGTHAPYAWPIEPTTNPVTGDAGDSDRQSFVDTDPGDGSGAGSTGYVTIGWQTSPGDLRFGFSVAVGDVDGDDELDIVIGAPGPEAGGLAGGVWILSPTGLTQPDPTFNPFMDNVSVDVPGSAGVNVWALREGEVGAPPVGSYLGWEVATYQVTNPLLRHNVLVSSPLFDSGAGQVLEITYDTSDSTTKIVASKESLAVGEQLGESIAICDLDGDFPADDIVIGATNPGGVGRVRVFRNGLGGAGSGDELGGQPGDYHSDNDYFGFAVVCGNFIDEGLPEDEIAVGAIYYDAPDTLYPDGSSRNNAGAVHVFQLTGPVFDRIQMYYPQNTSDQVGYALAAGEMDPGAFPSVEELVIGAARWDDNTDEFPDPQSNSCGGRSNRGAIFVVNPMDPGPGVDPVETMLADTPGRMWIEGERCDQLGRAVAVGDWNTDGWLEIFGSAGVDPNEADFNGGVEANPGEVWVFTTNDNDLDEAGNLRDPDDDDDCFADGWEIGEAEWELEPPTQGPNGWTTSPFVAGPNVGVFDLQFSTATTSAPGQIVTYTFTANLSCVALDDADGEEAVITFDVSNLGLLNDLTIDTANVLPTGFETPVDDVLIWRLDDSVLAPESEISFTVPVQIKDPVDSPEFPTGDLLGNPLDPDNIVQAVRLLFEFRNPLESQVTAKIEAGVLDVDENRDADSGNPDPEFNDNVEPRDDIPREDEVNTLIDLNVQKEEACDEAGDGTCHPGDPVQYTLTVWNPGDQDAGETTISDQLPSGLSYGDYSVVVHDVDGIPGEDFGYECTPPADPSADRPTFSCKLYDVPGRSTSTTDPPAVITVDAFVKYPNDSAAAIDPDFLPASVSELVNTAASDVFFNPSNSFQTVNEGSDTTNGIPIVNPRIAKAGVCDGGDPCAPLDLVVYDVRIWNTGATSDLTAGTMIDPKVPGMTFQPPVVYVTGGGGTAANTQCAEPADPAVDPVTCTFASITENTTEANAPIHIRLTYEIDDPKAVPSVTNPARLTLTNAPGLQNDVTAATIPIVDPDVLTVTQTIVAPTDVSQGTVNNLLQVLDLSVNNTDDGLATITDLTITRQGTAVDADTVAAGIKLWHDLNGNNVLDPAEPLVGTPQTFVGGVATFASIDFAVANGTPEKLLVTADIAVAGVSTEGNTIGSSIALEGDVVVQPADTLVIAVPLNGSLHTILDSGDTLTVDQTLTGGGNLVQDTTDNVMMILDLSMNNDSADLTDLTITRTGDATDADTTADGIKLWHDVNGNGALDGGDVQLSTSQTFNGGVVTFDAINLTVTATPPPVVPDERLLVTYDTTVTATPGATIGAQILDAAVVLVTAPDTADLATTPLNGDLYTIEDAADTLTVGQTATAGGPLTQGSTDNVVMILDLSMNQDSATLTSLVVTRTGAAVDADTTADGIKLWHDANGNGALDAGDTQLSNSKTFAGGVVTFDAIGLDVTDPDAEKLFVTYDIDAAATAGAAIGAQLVDAAAVTVDAPDNAALTATPLVGNPFAIADSGDQLTVGQTPTAGGPLPQGSTDSVVMVLDLSVDQDSVDLTDLVVTRTGTAGDVDTVLNGVKLWRDVNGNGALDGPDTQLSTSKSFIGGAVTFDAIGLTVQNPEKLLVTYSLSALATPETIGAQITNAGAVTVGAPDTAVLTATPLTGTPYTITDVPDQLTVGQTAAPAGDVTQGTTDNLMMIVDLSVNTDSVGLTDLTVTRTGTAQDADTTTDGIKLWYDLNRDGSLDAGDPQISTSQTFVGGAVTFSGITLAITPADAEKLFVTYDVAVTAVATRTIAAQITDTTAVTVIAPDTVALTATPLGGVTRNILASTDTLTIGQTSSGGADLVQGSLNNVVMILDLGVDANEVTLDTLTLTRTGTAADGDTTAGGVKLWRDLNGNGVLDGGDVPLSMPETFVGGVVTFAGIGLTVNDPTPEKLFVTCDIAGAATAAATLATQITVATDVSVAGTDDAAALSAEPLVGDAHAIVVSSADTLTVGQTGSGGADLPQDSTDNVVMILDLSMDANSTDLTALTINRTGTATDADTTANGIKLWHDLNRNGTFEPGTGDVQLGAAKSYSGATGVVTFDGFVLTVADPTAETLFVTYDIDAAATITNTIGAQLTAATDVTVSAADSVTATAEPLVGDAHAIVAAPAAVTEEPTLYIEGANSLISWLYTAKSAAPTYHLYRNDLQVLSAGGAYIQDDAVPEVQKWCGLTDTVQDDPAIPRPGKAFYYLVSAVDQGVDSGLGSDSQGLPRESGLSANGCQ